MKSTLQLRIISTAFRSNGKVWSFLYFPFSLPVSLRALRIWAILGWWHMSLVTSIGNLIICQEHKNGV